MTMPPSGSDAKARFKDNFNRIASDYDQQDRLRDTAVWLVQQAALPPGARVLDVATGTGWAAIEAARMVGPTGTVVGVDLAENMLDQARRKADALGINNIDFQAGDAERLEFADASFDAVLCASGLFFLDDMLGALREWCRVVKPGGQIAFTGFGTQFFQPLAELANARLARYGIMVTPAPTRRLADPDLCRSLLFDAGLERVEVRNEQRGYYWSTAEQYWENDVWSSVRRVLLMRLAPEQLEQYKQEHLAEVAALATPQGIWLDVPVNFARGWKR